MTQPGTPAMQDLVIDTQVSSGRDIRLRSVTRGDGPLLREGMARLSPEARYFRFFSGAQELPDRVVEALLSVDGIDHVAWGALDCDDPGAPAIGIVHAIRTDHSELMEYSAVVLGDYQGEGISKLLSAILFAQCLSIGEKVLTAHVLEENRRVKSYVADLGAERHASSGQIAEYRIDLAEALGILRKQDITGSEKVFDALSPYLAR